MARPGSLPETEFGGDYGLIQERDHFTNGQETASEKRMVTVMEDESSTERVGWLNPAHEDSLTIHDLERYRVQ